MDIIKLKSFYTAKEIINRMKRNLRNGRKYFQTVPAEELISKIYKELNSKQENR